jgi:hypothetical protein
MRRSTQGPGVSGSPIRTDRSRSASNKERMRPTLPRTSAPQVSAPVPQTRERVARRRRVKRRVLRNTALCKAGGHVTFGGGTLPHIAEVQG